MNTNTMPFSDEERIAHFFKEVGREFARRESAQNALLEAERKDSVQRARKALADEIKSYKEEKIREFMYENSRKASREILELKHESLALSEELLADIRAGIADKLRQFADSEAYYGYLLNTCLAAVEYVGEGFELHMSERDFTEYAEKLHADIEREFTAYSDEDIVIGGVRLCQNDRGITVNATLDEKLDDKMEELAKTGA